MPKIDVANMIWEAYEQYLRQHYTTLTNPPYSLDTYVAFGREVWEEYNVKPYKVWWINHMRYSDEVFSSEQQAVEYGKSKGFEFRVDYNTMPVCSWSPITGLRIW